MRQAKRKLTGKELERRAKPDPALGETKSERDFDRQSGPDRDGSKRALQKRRTQGGSR
jgi:hypothetical protein